MPACFNRHHKVVEFIPSIAAIFFRFQFTCFPREQNISWSALATSAKVYKPTPEEMKLWTEGKDEIGQQVYKDKPQVLEEVKKLEQQLAASRQKK